MSKVIIKSNNYRIKKGYYRKPAKGVLLVPVYIIQKRYLGIFWCTVNPNYHFRSLRSASFELSVLERQRWLYII